MQSQFSSWDQNSATVLFSVIRPLWVISKGSFRNLPIVDGISWSRWSDLILLGSLNFVWSQCPERGYLEQEKKFAWPHCHCSLDLPVGIVTSSINNVLTLMVDQEKSKVEWNRMKTSWRKAARTFITFHHPHPKIQGFSSWSRMQAIYMADALEESDLKGHPMGH